MLFLLTTGYRLLTIIMISAILLAAGESRRMGAFKPLLPFGARTVVAACVENLSAAGVEEIVVVLGARGAEVRARLAHLPVRFAVNEAAGSEMSTSIARGVERLSSEARAVLIALGDQPAVTSDVIARVLAAHRQTGARLVVPEYEGRGGHPVLIDLAYRAELLSLDPARGLRALFERHEREVRRVPVLSPYVRRDMDTWDDYRALHEEIFHAPPPCAPPPRSG
jgi:molybdenum cofactor cytidylyltransferase